MYMNTQKTAISHSKYEQKNITKDIPVLDFKIE